VLKGVARPFAARGLARYATLLALLLIVALAAYLRLYNLLPTQRGLQAPQDYDEGVWDSTAQLWLQGYLPYRDFFATLPPVGIYLLAGVLRLVDVPWGSGLGLMATRYVSVLYGLITVALVYLLGRKLSGRAVGLAAASLLAVDGMVLGMDRLALLEPPLNLFSVLAVLAYLSVFERGPDDGQGRRMAVLAGVLAALASLAKTPGVVVIVALLTVSLLRRRFREAVTIAVSFALAWLVLSAHFLLRCPGDFLKQVYFFQLLRPADGVVHRLARLYHIWHYGQAWSTVRFGLLGGLCISLLAIWRREARPWWIVLVWAGYSLLLIVANSSYYPQYYVQLAVPLCLLGGGLLDMRIGPIWRSTADFRSWPNFGSLTLGGCILMTILAIGVLRGHIVHQYQDIMQRLGHTDATYAQVADYIQQNSSPDAQILVFEPNYTFLSSRPPAGVRAGQFLVDSYGEMLYVNLGVESQTLWELAKAVWMGQKSALQPTFWRSPAQEAVLTAFERADYVVIDGRARYQLQPQTLAMIQSRSAEVFAFGVASVRKKEP